MNFSFLKCRKCGLEKSVEHFARDKKSASGYDSRCNICERERSMKYREMNPQKVKTSQAKYNATLKRVVTAARYQRSAKAKALHERYRKLHPERLKKRAASWLREHPESNRLKTHRRRARVRGNGVFKILSKELRHLYSQPCFACGSLENQTADHAIPVSRGGRHSIGNLITLCKTCNIKKHNRLFVEWRAGKQATHRIAA